MCTDAYPLFAATTMGRVVDTTIRLPGEPAELSLFRACPFRARTDLAR
jgi:hypothetical protein